MALRKRCRHGRGLTGAAKRRVWRGCSCTWVSDVYVDGRRRFIAHGSDEQRARIADARLMADLMEGREVRRRPGRGFREIAEDWLAMKAASPEARDNSITTYRSRIRRLVEYFGERDIGDITVDHVRRFLARLTEAGGSPATHSGLYAALRSVLGHAHDLGLIEVMPLPRRGVEGIRPRETRLTLADVDRVIAAMPPEWGSAAELVVLTGLRIGEVQALTRDQVDLTRRTISIEATIARSGRRNPPKTRAGIRVVPLSPRACSILQERLALHPDGRLWPGHYRDALAALHAVLVSLGLHRPGLAWHTIRAAHSALLEDAGLTVRDAAARMGHGANTAQTLSYQWRGEVGGAGAIDETRHAASRRERKGRTTSGMGAISALGSGSGEPDST